jgi:hypothetical protein
MAFTARSFAGGALRTTLSADMTSGQTTLSMSASPASLNWVETYGANVGSPLGTSGPFFVIVDAGQATEEKVLATGISGSTLTGLTRAADGGTAYAHVAANAYAVYPVGAALDFYEANLAVTETLGLVAAAGDLLVGAGANELARLAAGTSGYLLSSTGSAVQWIAPPSAPTDSGWIAISGGLLGANFTHVSMEYRLQNNEVRLRGQGAGGGSFAGGTAFTLPSGYRPAQTLSQPVWENTAAQSIACAIATTGVATIANTGTNVVNFDGVTFTID